MNWLVVREKTYVQVGVRHQNEIESFKWTLPNVWHTYRWLMSCASSQKNAFLPDFQSSYWFSQLKVFIKLSTCYLLPASIILNSLIQLFIMHVNMYSLWQHFNCFLIIFVLQSLATELYYSKIVIHFDRFREEKSNTFENGRKISVKNIPIHSFYIIRRTN